MSYMARFGRDVLSFDDLMTSLKSDFQSRKYIYYLRETERSFKKPGSYFNLVHSMILLSKVLHMEAQQAF